MAVVWHSNLSDVERGSCGLCCVDHNAWCRTAVGSDGTVGLLLPVDTDKTVVATFDAKGSRLGAKEVGLCRSVANRVFSSVRYYFLKVRSCP